MDSRAGTPAQPSDLVDVEAAARGVLHRGARRDRSPSSASCSARAATAGRPSTPRSTRRTSPRSRRRSSSTAPGRASPVRCSSAGTRTRSAAPAETTALEVLVGERRGRARRRVRRLRADARASATRSSLEHRQGGRGEPEADGIVITPSHNPPRDGGFKYNPPHGGPADSDATTLDREPRERAHRRRQPTGVKRGRADARVDDLRLPQALRRRPREHHRHRRDQGRGLHIGADPLGGASVHYWDAHRARPTASTSPS